MEKPIVRPFIEKYASGEITFGVSYDSPELEADDLIIGVVGYITPTEVGGLQNDGTTYDNSSVAIKVSGGIAGHDYQVRLEATTYAGNVLNSVVLVRIVY